MANKSRYFIKAWTWIILEQTYEPMIVFESDDLQEASNQYDAIVENRDVPFVELYFDNGEETTRLKFKEAIKQI